MLGPIFAPTGFLMPRRYSIWAWSSWRVRSPTQSICPDVAYQSPEVEVDAGEGLLVAEQQRLVAGIEARGAKLRRVVGVQPAGAHEAQGLGDVLGELLVAMPGRAVLDEAEIPAMHMLEIGIAALGEGAQQIERRRRLAVGHQHALRVGHAGRFGELGAVDDVAAIARQLLAVSRLGRARPRLGELAGDAAELHHRRAAGIGEHHRHLQEHAEEIADGIGAMLGEALGAVPALEQEGLARGDAGELRLQLARLSGEHERRKSRKLLLNLGERGRVGVDGHLLDRFGAPAVWAPSGRHRRLSFTKVNAI